MNPYKILGITENASDEEVKRAYRSMALKYHPDTGGDAWAFEQVREAYEAIVRVRRSKSSAERREPVPPPKPSAPKPPSSQQPESAARTAFSAQPPTSPLGVQAALHQLVNVLFKHKLPLQTETSFFILANVLDIVFTNILLRLHAIESNPIANYVFIYWGFHGMIAFKLFLVACVCLITQLIAVYHLRRARQTLWLGTAIVSTVVAYSAHLLVRHYS